MSQHKVCCLDDCPSTSRSRRLYRMPRNGKLRSLWCSILAPYCKLLVDDSDRNLRNRSVCELHFEQEMIMSDSRKRKYFGCPTLLTREEILSGKPSVPIRITSASVGMDHSYSANGEHGLLLLDHTYAVIQKARDYKRKDIFETGSASHKRERLNDEKVADAVPEVPCVGAESPGAGAGSPCPSPGIEAGSPCPSPGIEAGSPCPSPIPSDGSEEETLRLSVTCQQCDMIIEGPCLVCVTCGSGTECGQCAGREEHRRCYLLRVPPHKPQWEVQAVLHAARTALSMRAFADQLAEPPVEPPTEPLDEQTDGYEIKDEPESELADFGDILRMDDEIALTGVAQHEHDSFLIDECMLWTADQLGAVDSEVVVTDTGECWERDEMASDWACGLQLEELMETEIAVEELLQEESDPLADTDCSPSEEALWCGAAAPGRPLRARLRGEPSASVILRDTTNMARPGDGDSPPSWARKRPPDFDSTSMNTGADREGPRDGATSIRKCPPEADCAPDTPEGRLLSKFEQTDVSKDKIISRRLRHNIAHNLPKVNVLKTTWMRII